MMEPEDDLFGGIVMSEERYHGEGYEEGFAEGNHIGETEGKQYGAVYGAKMGSELGCYLGFASTWRLLLSPITDEKQSKKIKTLDSLIKMIESFPSDDPTNETLQEELSRIRGKVKQVCSMLNIQPDFRINHENSGLSF
ncbi:protein LTO1 homolog isoform X2 [Bufo gargarizans]|uniref:protein LTO1 homolog isoform X2 n=1 Tax=Bufo gargarizans TaxID=30331 RepID=UPI001CF5DFA1|nr:protein LTO1 homolog isoform X2 [Bufo gargarizans]